MSLKSTLFPMICALFVANAAFGQVDLDYLTVKKIKVQQVVSESLNSEKMRLISEDNIETVAGADAIESFQNIGKVIAVTREIVALGEEIYKLVKKGEPVLKTSYTPISVLPKVNNAPVSIMDTENWRAPVKYTYRVTCENLYGMDVVSFKYSVIYSYGGSYNGKGLYLTSAQVVPDSVSVAWGYNFDANMRLGGIQNLGTKENPIASAILQLEYTISTVLKADKDVYSYHITGRGGFKEL
jgi:hypothetical protein